MTLKDIAALMQADRLHTEPKAIHVLEWRSNKWGDPEQWRILLGTASLDPEPLYEIRDEWQAQFGMERDTPDVRLVTYRREEPST